MVKKLFAPLFAFMALMLGMIGSAHAAVDTTAALAGVTDAQTALLALLGGFIALSSAIFGVAKVYAFLKRKAGA